MKFGRHTIVVSSKEKDHSVAEELARRYWDILVLDIVTADYAIYGLPGGVLVERKKDLSELIKSMAGNVRYNTDKECMRAQAAGSPLYYVIGEKVTKSGVVLEDAADIGFIERDDLRLENQHEDICEAIKMIRLMEREYGTHFLFVEPEKMVDTIEFLLETQPGTPYEHTP